MTPSGPRAVLQIQFQVTAMTEHSLWRFSRALHRAINERQPEDLEALLDEEVEWAIYGPIDILPHLGHRHGKAEIGAMWRTVHKRYSEMRHEVPFLVAEQDRVAASIRVFFRKRANGRIVQFDIAAFYTLRDGRIATIHEILDSFEVVQQILERDIAAELIGTKSKTG